MQLTIKFLVQSFRYADLIPLAGGPQQPRSKEIHCPLLAQSDPLLDGAKFFRAIQI